MRTRIVGSLIVAAAVLGAVPIHSQQPSAPWPPTGVYRAKDVDALPKTIKRVSPAYTEAAIRARVTGTVRLECIVKADGTVGEVRVTRSLDERYGLDDQAVSAVKQWQFTPGTKDEKPVDVLVEIEVGFTLRDGSSATALSWPAGFSAAPEGERQWSTVQIESESLRIHLEVPDGWQIQQNPSPLEAARITNASQTAAIAVTKPRLTGASFDQPMEPDHLQAIVDRMKQTAQARAPDADVLAFGQSWGEPGRIQVWLEWSAGGRHAYVFQTGTGGREVQLLVATTLPGVSENEFAQLDSITADAGAMLRRVRMSVAP